MRITKLLGTLWLACLGSYPHLMLSLDNEFTSSHTFEPPPSVDYLSDDQLMALIEKAGQETFPEDLDCADGHVNPKYDARASIAEHFTHVLLLPYTKSGYDKSLIVMESPARREFRVECKNEDRDFINKYRVLWVGRASGSKEWKILFKQPTPVNLSNLSPFYYDQIIGGEWVLMGFGMFPYLGGQNMYTPWYLFSLRNEQIAPLCWAPAKGSKLQKRAYFDDDYARALGCAPVYFTENCHSFMRDRSDRIAAIYEHECEGQAHPEYNNEDYVPPKRKDYIEYYSLKRKTFVQSNKPMAEGMIKRLSKLRDQRLRKKNKKGDTAASSANARKS